MESDVGDICYLASGGEHAYELQVLAWNLFVAEKRSVFFVFLDDGVTSVQGGAEMHDHRFVAVEQRHEQFPSLFHGPGEPFGLNGGRRNGHLSRVAVDRTPGCMHEHDPGVRFQDVEFLLKLEIIDPEVIAGAVGDIPAAAPQKRVEIAVADS